MPRAQWTRRHGDLLLELARHRPLTASPEVLAQFKDFLDAGAVYVTPVSWRTNQPGLDVNDSWRHTIYKLAAHFDHVVFVPHTLGFVARSVADELCDDQPTDLLFEYGLAWDRWLRLWLPETPAKPPIEFKDETCYEFEEV